jgi:hypothetical protein
MREIRISGAGLRHKKIFLASQSGNWEQKERLEMSQNMSFFLSNPDLQLGEEFKLMVVDIKNELEAREIFNVRIADGVMVGQRFDWDAQKKLLWLLVPGFQVIRFGEWNQNNVY